MGAAEKIKPGDKKAGLKEVAPEVEHAEDNHEEEAFFRGSHKKAEEGEGPWLMSYADMMTLLMGFFALIASFSKVDSTEFEKVKKEAVKYFGGEYKEPYGDLAKVLKKVVAQNGMNDQVQVEQGPDGVSLTFRGTLLFDSGSFDVKSDARPLMQKITDVVFENAADHNVVVEGHTDNVPISHPVIASNWELSAMRAARVARLFEDSGFKKPQLAIQGWGEVQPQVPNDNPDGSPNLANRSRNRRVHIRIYKKLPGEAAHAAPGPAIPPPPDKSQVDSANSAPFHN